jgi:hypothetical protein
MKNLKTFAILFFCSLVITTSLIAQSKVKSKTQTKFSIPVVPTSGIFTYYSEEDVIMGSSPVIVGKLIIFQADGEFIRGFYGYAAQGEQNMYFTGTRKGNVIVGKSYNFYDKSEDNFKLTLMGNFVSFETSEDKIKLPAKRKDIVDKQLTVYQNPDKKSTVLARDLDLEKKGFKLIEIGEMEKMEDTEDSEYNVWCKIKNQNMEGWVLGLFRVF